MDINNTLDYPIKHITLITKHKVHIIDYLEILTTASTNNIYRAYYILFSNVSLNVTQASINEKYLTLRENFARITPLFHFLKRVKIPLKLYIRSVVAMKIRLYKLPTALCNVVLFFSPKRLKPTECPLRTTQTSFIATLIECVNIQF